MDNVLAGLCSNGTDDVRDRSTYTRHLENVFNVKQEHACISQYGAAVENTEIACQNFIFMMIHKISRGLLQHMRIPIILYHFVGGRGTKLEDGGLQSWLQSTH
ncbi:uncharacterized protein LOC143899235 isoform X1 [Temnothorax americanus]|uniref:uncharacterized protein LOC143899235 isoform X1 n=1 Tax=Temnothorax americanus TaxID=1964332 RepID=UPI0040692578